MELNTGLGRVAATPVNAGDGAELLRAVQAAATASGRYDVLGALGRGAGGRLCYLASEAGTRGLVVLELDRAGDPSSFHVAQTLDGGLVPGAVPVCEQCGAPLVSWGAYCPQCGTAVVRVEPGRAVRDADSSYEVLGDIARADGGGRVSFARDTTGRLLTLHASAHADGVPTPAAAAAPARIIQPTAQRHTPQEVLLPADQLPADETLPQRPQRGVRPWMIAAVAGVVVLLAGAVYVRARLRAPDATALDTGLALAGGAGAARPATARITLAATLPRGARVTVDGIAWRPPGVALPPGTYTLGVDAPGYAPLAETHTLAAGDTLAWSPVLTAVRQTAAPAPARPARKPKPVPAARQPAAPAQAPAVAATPAAAAATCQSAFDAKNWPAAATLCARDAHAGDAAAAHDLGVMYAQGSGVTRNLGQAATWFRASADAGNRDAAVQLAGLYETGRGVPRDARQATEWYRKAALLGDAGAQVKVGMAYEDGTGVGVNPSEAATWYTKAAGQGNAWAQNRLGWMYGMGHGVSRDDARAMKYFRQAAEQGDAQAQYNLGFMYANGRGVARDDSLAVSWFRKAAAQGYGNAQKELERRGIVP